MSPIIDSAHRLSPQLERLWRTPLFIIGITGLILLLAAQSLQQQQSQLLIDQRDRHYVQALATTAAQQAIDATLNNDLISLQVTLQDIIEHPDLISATIHDVENRLLVQAGQSPNFSDPTTILGLRSFTAPITLHDSIAGYVTITLDSHALLKQQDDTWLLALATLFITLIGWSLLNPIPSSDNASTLEAKEEEKEANLPPRQSSNDCLVDLVFNCQNLAPLKKQLSGSKREALFNELERLLSGVNTLYSGRIIEATPEQLVVRFHDSDTDNASFRALCAAQLLFQLQSQQGGLQLQYSAALTSGDHNPSLSTHLDSHQIRQQAQQLHIERDPFSLLIHQTLLPGSQLSQRIQLQEIDANWIQLAALKPSYQTLLDKQVSQLQQLLTQS